MFRKMGHFSSRAAFEIRPRQKCRISQDFSEISGKSWAIHLSQKMTPGIEKLARNVLNDQSVIPRRQILPPNISKMAPFSLKWRIVNFYESESSRYLIHLSCNSPSRGHIAGAKFAHFLKIINFFGKYTDQILLVESKMANNSYRRFGKLGGILEI